MTMKQCTITGAADGIGKALAQRFAAANYTIIGIDIDTARAAEVQASLDQGGATASFVQADLANSTDIERVLDQLASAPPSDVFVQNVGISAVGPFAQSDLTRQRAVLDINLRAPLLLTPGLLRRQLIAPGGTLVFIASLSHFVSYPGAAVYAASKDGLSAYARSLALALAPQGINVLTVYPGPTNTAHARRYSPDNRRAQQRMPPERLAEAIYQAVQRRQRLLIPGMGNRLFAALGYALPGLSEWLMRKMILEKIENNINRTTHKQNTKRTENQ